MSKALRRKADRLFSLYVRRNQKCEVCETNKHLQTAHVNSRGIICIRYDEDNVLCLCGRHHIYYTYRPLHFAELVKKIKGKKIYNKLLKAEEENKVEINEDFYNNIIAKYSSPVVHKEARRSPAKRHNGKLRHNSRNG